VVVVAEAGAVEALVVAVVAVSVVSVVALEEAEVQVEAGKYRMPILN
jgi:hypothetical protein